MGKNGRFWLIFAILALIAAIVNFISGTRIDLIIMPVVFSILFAFIYINMKSGGKFTFKKERHKKRFLIIFIILLLIVVMIASVASMDMNIIIILLGGVIISIINYIRFFVLKKQMKSRD